MPRKHKRKCDTGLQKKYPGSTAIERAMFHYSIGRNKKSGCNTARLVQFPLKRCFAATSHKFRGQTVVKPMKLLVDLRFEFAAAMAYVMLSRVQIIEQLFILESLPENKIFADAQALNEFGRLNSISIPPNGSKTLSIVSGYGFKLSIFEKHFQHIAQDSIMSSFISSKFPTWCF